MAKPHTKYNVGIQADVIMDHTSYEGTHVHVVNLVTADCHIKNLDSAANIIHRAKKGNAPILFLTGAVYGYSLYELISEAHSSGLSVHIVTDGAEELKFCDGEWIEQPDMIHLLMPTMHCHPKTLMLAGEVMLHGNDMGTIEGAINELASALVKNKIEHHFVGVPVLIAPYMDSSDEDDFGNVLESLKTAVMHLVTPWGSGLRLVRYAGDYGVRELLK